MIHVGTYTSRLCQSKKHIRRYIILGIMGNLCAAGGIRVLQRILDGLAAGTVKPWLLALYALLLLEPQAGAYLNNHPDQSLRHGIYLQLKTDALEKMRTVSYTVWQKFGMGTLIQRVEAGAEAGRDMFCDFYIRLVADMVPQIIITALFIALTDMRVFYWVLAGYAAVFVITNLLLKKLYSIKDRILTSEEAFNHRLVRGFMELVVFRIYRRFGEEVRRARAEAETVRSARVKIVMIHEAFFALFCDSRQLPQAERAGLRHRRKIAHGRRSCSADELSGQRIPAHRHFQRVLCGLQAEPGSVREA